MSIAPPPKKKALDLAPVAAPKPLSKSGESKGKPLNFSVSPEFKRQFKAYAASRDESMVEILIRAVTREMEGEG
ncbi:MAG: hypothetical protein ACRCXB_22920 [Aeromonadaceae bacterium]